MSPSGCLEGISHLNLRSFLKLKVNKNRGHHLHSPHLPSENTSQHFLLCFLLQWKVAPSFLLPNGKSRNHSQLISKTLCQSFHISLLIATASVQALLISPLGFGNIWFCFYLFLDHFFSSFLFQCCILNQILANEADEVKIS